MHRYCVLHPHCICNQVESRTQRAGERKRAKKTPNIHAMNVVDNSIFILFAEKWVKFTHLILVILFVL